MARSGSGRRIASLIAGVLLISPLAVDAVRADPPATEAPADMQKRMAVYRNKLAEYNKAWDAYEKVAGPYWRAVTDKRSARRAKRAHGGTITAADYELRQPPIYNGPPKPKNPEEEKKPPPRAIPIVEDFLANAKEHFGFKPQAAASEVAFKQAYAKVASAAGLTKESCVKIYGFESGGNGKYDVQAGLEYDTPGAHAISTALGYNQLLKTNSVELVAEAGDGFVAALENAAQGASDERKAQLQHKLAVLKKMIAFSRTVPDDWNAHDRLGKTGKGLGVHAANLDVDLGPLLQTEKLLTSVKFARRLGYTTPLTAAELEMMNLTGDGNGFDMVQMPQDTREKVPTSNFFQRGGYERNPVAARNNTVAKLLAATDAKMVQEAQLQGAKDLAAAFDAAAQSAQK
jgi:hypothetical protein